jgi:acetyltransferase
VCHSANEAISFADHVGFPLALRVVSRDIVHKTEVGGVALNLANPAAVRHAWDKVHRDVARAMPGAAIEGLLVRRMIPAGHELILGARRDPSFGPIVMFGLGGIYVELMKDVTFAIAPLDAAMAQRSIRRTRAAALLTGARGQAHVGIDPVSENLVRLGQLICDFPQIADVEVNPLIVSAAAPAGAVADARIRIHDPTPSALKPAQAGIP